jgi:hypothetical protein
VPRVAILFGAGASFGCGAVSPSVPPLGAQLYEGLQEEYPDTWGRLITADEDAAFRADPPFEQGMGMVWDAREERAQLLITDLALFLCRFVPTDHENLYGQLVERLVRSGVILSTLFATLNYECIFEMAAASRGMQVRYMPHPPTPNGITLLKPHGSCNFVMEGLGQGLQITNMRFSGIGGTGGGAYWEGPIDARRPDEIAALYAAGPSPPPAISLYAPGKPAPAAPGAINAIRAQWARWISEIDVLIVIGARAVLADGHAWQPVISSSAEVWYVTPDEESFMELRENIGQRLTHIAHTFAEAVPVIDRRLQLLP